MQCKPADTPTPPPVCLPSRTYPESAGCPPCKAREVKEYTAGSVVCKTEPGDCSHDVPNCNVACVPVPGSCTAVVSTQCGQTTQGVDSCNRPCSKLSSACPGQPTATVGPGQPTVPAAPAASPTPVQQVTTTTIPTPTKSPGQTSTGGQTTNQRWACLKSEPCSVAGSQCAGKYIQDSGHRVKLSTKTDAKPLAGVTYIFECLLTPGGQKCTTGDSATDRAAIGVDQSSAYQSAYGYNKLGFFKQDGITSANNPIQTPSSQDIGVYEWESKTKDTLGHVFLAMNNYSTTTNTGSQGGQQQATFSFDPSNKNCVVIRWDPEGRVYDSYSLEPISNATVKLVSPQQTQVLGGLVTSYTTKQDGSYFFFVPDGKYWLQAQAPNYIFPSNNPLSSEGYIIYSNTYTGGEVVQKGAVEHRDIPLDPVNNDVSKQSATSNTVKMLGMSQVVDKKTNQYVVEGVVSHPVSQLTLYSKKNNEKIRAVTVSYADKKGNFKLSVDLSILGASESIGVLEIKKNEYIFPFAKQTAVTVIHLDPILSYLDGYADPNAIVSVNLSFSHKAFLTTNTDDKGHFSVDSNYLPAIPYYLSVRTKNGATQDITTSEFLAKNNTIHSASNVAGVSTQISNIYSLALGIFHAVTGLSP